MIGGEKLRAALVACAFVATASGCGALKVKAGPLGFGADVGPQMGASVNVQTAEGKQLFGVDLRAGVDAVIGLVGGLLNGD